MLEQTPNSMAKLAFGLCLGGVILAVAVTIVTKSLGGDGTLMAYCIFAAFQIAALVLGVVTRANPLGKTAAISSAMLLVGSLAFIS
jgi:hypothetical protein